MLKMLKVLFLNSSHICVLLFVSVFASGSASSLKHGQQLYRHIYLGCKEEDNVHKNFELLFTTLAILTIELANEEVVIDLIRLAIALQVKPMNSHLKFLFLVKAKTKSSFLCLVVFGSSVRIISS